MTGLKRTVCIFLGMMCIGVTARAETILITSGSMVWTGLNNATPVTLSGAGFSFQGVGLNGLEVDIINLPSLPTTFTLPTHWSDGDLPGTATHNGVTYLNIGGGNDASLSATWSTTFTVPAGFSTGTFTMPFSFTGMFFTGAPGEVVGLSGGGTATVELRRDESSPQLFPVVSARYEFGESAAAVPEPMSMLLVGTGLAGLAMRRRRKEQ